MAGYQCLLAVDRDPAAVRCYNRNLGSFGPGRAIVGDLRFLDSPAKVGEFLEHNGLSAHRACDVLIGGPPCQGYAVVGRNKIAALARKQGVEASTVTVDERNHLFESFALFIEVLKPRWFLFENVPTILSHPVFPQIIDRFRNLRDNDGTRLPYTLVHANYLASRYGVPQDRRRFILVGYLASSGIRAWVPPKQRPPVTVSEAIDDLPPVPHGHRERVMQYTTPPLTPYQELMRLPGPSGEVPALRDHICRWHNPDDVALFARMRPGARFADPDVQAALREINPAHKLIKYSTDKFKDKLHRLDGGRPAWTVTAHLQKDCYKFIHHRQPRTITVREAARLQSFPDWFTFDDESMVRAFGLLGNAVPPLLAQAFAESFVASDRVLRDEGGLADLAASSRAASYREMAYALQVGAAE